MHAALQVRDSQRAAGNGSVSGSVKSAKRNNSNGNGNVSSGMEVAAAAEEEEEEENEGSEMGSDGDSEGEACEEEGDEDEGGMEVEAGDIKRSSSSSSCSGKGGNRPRPRLCSSASSSAGAGFSAGFDGITVPEASDFIQTGQYVCVELEDVPALVVQRLQQYGFLLCYSLYQHEQKMSVLHFHIQKHPSHTEPIKSKDELLFMVSEPASLPASQPASMHACTYIFFLPHILLFSALIVS